MAALDDLVAALRENLRLAKDSVDHVEETGVPDKIDALSDTLSELAKTIEPDQGNVIPGFEDKNAELRGQANELLKQLAAKPLVTYAEAAAIGSVAMLFVGGAAAAPALVIGGVAALAAIGTDLAVSKFITMLSSMGITIVGQDVDYSSFYPDPSLGGTTGLKIVGSIAPDTIKTTKFDDTVLSSWFGDTIHNPGGSDKIDGGLGYDTVSYAEHNSGIVFYGSSLTVSHSYNETDTLIGVEQVDGTSKGDFFDVSTGNVSFMTLHGLGGDDTFVVAGPAFRVNIDGGGSLGDTLDMRASGMSYVVADLAGTVAGAGQDIELHLNGIHTYYGIEKEDDVTGSNSADVIYTEGGRDKVYAGGGDDEVHGGQGLDHLYGEEDNDALYGDGDTDYIVGGSGTDVLYGGDGDDVLIASNIDGSGNTNTQDVLSGGAGRDYLILTADGGSTVFVEGGDKNDRLLIHSSLLGDNAPGGEGTYSLFELRGGVFLKVATAGEGTVEEQVGGLLNANFQPFDGGGGVRTWYYSTKAFEQPTYIESGLYKGFSATDPSTDPEWHPAFEGYLSQPIWEDNSLPFLIEYDLYEGEGSSNLYISIYSSFEKTSDYFPRGERPLIESIVIEDFHDGDYGIRLNQVYDPYKDVGLDYSPNFYDGGDAATNGSAYYYNIYGDTDAYANSYDPGIVAQYTEDVKYISEQKYGLTVEGGIMQSARMMASMASSTTMATEPDLASMELIITITGGSDNDLLQGLDVKERIHGGDGNDIIRGDGGDDENFGDAGNDRIYGGAGADLIDGGDGVDTADYRYSAAAVTVDLATHIGSGGEAQGDVIFAVENIAGSAFNDILTGDEGVNRLVGGDGSDTLNGGGGDDILIGGLGADILVGGAGLRDAASYQDASAGVVVNLVSGGTAGEAAGDTYNGVEYVYGSAFNDTIIGNDVANRLVGSGGADSLNGGAGNDVLVGGQGADTLIGGTGDQDVASYEDASAGVVVNLVSGGTAGEAAGDTYNGIEYVYGSAFNDTIIGNDAVNRLVGGEGNDVLDGGAGNDVLVGGQGADTLIGGAGDQDAASYQDAQLAVIVNLALGGTGGEAAGDTYSGIEYVYGSAFNDQIIGDGAINRLTGGAGNDTLDGAAGNDYLLGDTGNDMLVGGAGADVFVFNAGFGDDTISDFWAGAGRTDRAWFQGVTGINSYADVLAHAADSAAGVVISVAGQGSLTLSGLTIAQLNADDFLFG